MIVVQYQGRLGNKLLQTAGASILAKKKNLKVANYDPESKSFGMKLFEGGRHFSDGLMHLSDNHLMAFMEEELVENMRTGWLLNCGFQVKDFILKYEDEIREHFPVYYAPTEKRNNLFVHVRLDDVANINPGFDYYDKCIKDIDFEKGHISSDDPRHPIPQALAKKYNLNFVNASPSNTIKFATNFDNLVLSGGTFSWWMGFLGRAKNIYYPLPVEGKIWHGDIFCFPRWKGVEVGK